MSTITHIRHSFGWILIQLLLLAVAMCGPAEAVSQELTGEYTLTSEDGLPGDRYRDLAEDSMGLLWIATNAGLVRYDGSRFKIYTTDKTDPRSIRSSSTTRLLIDGNQLWCTTSLGISRLDMKADTFANYSFVVQSHLSHRANGENIQGGRALVKLRNGEIWAGLTTDGVVRYDTQLDSFIRVKPPTDMVVGRSQNWSMLNVLSMMEDRFEDGIIWVGTLGGAVRIDSRTEEFEVFYMEQEDKDHETNLNAFRRINQLPDGRIVWATWNAGLNILDPKTGTYEHVSDRQGDKGVLNSTLSTLMIVGDTTLWVTSGIGAVAYNLLDWTVAKSYRNDFYTGHVYRFDYMDREGRVYGLYERRITVYDPLLQQFVPNSFIEFDPGYRGMVFSVDDIPGTGKYFVCGRSEGMYIYDTESQAWEAVPSPPGFSDRRPTCSAAAGGLRRFWVGYSDYLVEYDYNRKGYTGLVKHIELPIGSVKEVFEDSHGVVWITTNRDGIYTWNRNTDKFEKLTWSGRYSASSAEMGSLYEDAIGNVWIKQRNAYYVYDYRNGKLHQIEHPGTAAPFCRAFAEDGKGNMWITSSTYIYKASVEHPEWGIMDTVKKGVLLWALDADKNGILWGPVKDRLYRYDPATDSLSSFSYMYGEMPTALFSFNVMDDGTIVIGDFDRVITSKADRLQGNSALARPYVTSVTVGGDFQVEDLLPGNHAPIELSPKQNSFSIEYSSIAFTNSEHNAYRYRLVDLQPEWTEVRDLQTINYTNVPSGNYVFELAAANNEGAWNPAVFKLPINVATPWYNTGLARGLGMILLVTLIYLGYQYRVSQIRKEERLRTKFERELADVEMTALRAQMNPHFIFNCLNSIENFVIKNDTLRASSYLHDFARLIRLILQNSRSKYIPLKDELEALELYLEMESLRFAGKFEYEIVVEPEVDVNQLEVPPMIIQPYVENAIWHGLIPKRESGSLTIHLARNNGTLSCSIEDNGIGRAMSAEINSKRKNDKPKSMGMTITRDRIQMLNKLYNTNTTINIIDLTDGTGQASGTRVELNVPV